MQQFVLAHIDLTNLLCGVLLLSRIADLGSTYLVSPQLRLEANPIAHRLGWPFAFATLLVAAVPYFSTGLAIVVIVPSLLAAAQNLATAWVVRAIGEEAYLRWLTGVAAAGRLSEALLLGGISATLIFLAGGLLWFLSLNSPRDWAYCFAIGLMIYGLAILVYRSLFLVRLFRRAVRKGEPIAVSD